MPRWSRSDGWIAAVLLPAASGLGVLPGEAVPPLLLTLLSASLSPADNGTPDDGFRIGRASCRSQSNKLAAVTQRVAGSGFAFLGASNYSPGRRIGRPGAGPIRRCHRVQVPSRRLTQ